MKDVDDPRGRRQPAAPTSASGDKIRFADECELTRNRYGAAECAIRFVRRPRNGRRGRRRGDESGGDSAADEEGGEELGEHGSASRQVGEGSIITGRDGKRKARTA